jgi:flagellar hook-basal body complex protein FliE
MSDMTIQQVLAEARALAQRAAGVVPSETPRSQGSDFVNVLKRSFEQVNAMQERADDLATRFSAGADDTSLPDVMVAEQKASLGFEAVTQVRNRLLAAYQEIMNMQV